jgi:hypothetical protein
VSALLAGNACLVVASPVLDAAIRALREAGVPPSALREAPGDASTLLALAARREVAFAATDAGRPFTRALYRALGPTVEGQRSLKALLSRLDGPQPGEPGFARRFAWPRVVAVRTLRHGADLALETAAER